MIIEQVKETKAKILVVDNEQSTVMFIKRALEKFGYEKIDNARNGVEAIQFVKSNPPNLILMDCNLEGDMDGIETSEKILEIADIPIIFVTACSYETTIQSTKQVAPYGYLIKPFESQVLYSTIEMALNRFSLEKSLKENEAKLRALFECTRDAIGVSKKGIHVYANPAYLKLFGYENHEALVGTSIIDCIAESHHAQVNDYIRKRANREEVPSFYETRGRRRDGSEFDFEINVSSYELVGEKYTIANIRDITGKNKIEENTRANYDRLNSLLKILQYESDSIQEFLDHTLSEAIRLTKSKIGYIYHYSEEKKEFVLNTWSKEVMKECSILEQQTVYQLDKTGLWGEAVRQRKAIMVNDFHAANQFKKGYPEGHAQLKKFLTVPIFSDNRIDGVVGVANKETDYDDTDILQLSLLLDAVWKVVEKKKAVELLQQSNAILQTAMDQSSAGIAIADAPDGTLRYVNDAGLLIRGGDRQTIVDGVGINEYVSNWKLFDLDGQPLGINEVPLARAVMYGETGSSEFVIRREKDDDRIVLANAAPILDSKGEITAGIVVFTDITERRQTEEKLKESELRFRELYENAPVGLYRTTPDGKILLANKALCKMLGFSSFEELSKRNLEESGFELSTQRKYFKEQIEKLGEVNGLEAKWKRYDGSTVIIKESAKVVRDSEHKSIYYDGTVEDITERKLIEETQMFLLHTSSNVNGDFFTALASYLAKCLEMNYVCIDQLHDDNLAAKTLAIYYDGKFEDNVEYTLKETPCGDVVGKTICCFPEKVCSLFPNDIVLQDIKAESYIGTTLWSSDHRPIGLIAVIGKKRLENQHLAETILKLVAIRSASELERKQAENLLREKEYQYHNLADSGTALIWTSGADKLCNYFNEPWLKFTGRTLEQEIGNGWAEGVHPDDFNSCLKTYVESFDKQESFDMEYRLRHSSGEYRWLRDMGVPNYKVNGEFIGYIGHCFDITEQKRAEETIKLSNSLLNASLESTPDGILVVDLNGKLSLYNQKFIEMWKIPDRILSLKDDKQLLTFVLEQLNNPEEFISKVNELYKRQEESSFDILNLSQGRVFERYSLPQKIGGVIVGRVWSFRDITESRRVRKELENYQSHLKELVKERTEKLNEVNKTLLRKIEKENEYKLMLQKSLEKEKELSEMKSQFISTASHEFRTPLTSVLTSSGLLQKYMAKWDDEKKNEHFERIKSSVTYLTKLLDDVLTINRVESGNIIFTAELVELKAFTEECIEESKQISENHQLTLNYNSPQSRFKLDSKLLRFILNNLLSNAIKYSPAGGKVEVTISSDKNHLYVEVRDEGVGIHSNEISKVFDAFYRSRDAENISGNGLGLSIAKRAADLHKGEIKIKSEFGKGSTFLVKFPLQTG